MKNSLLTKLYNNYAIIYVKHSSKPSYIKHYNTIPSYIKYYNIMHPSYIKRYNTENLLIWKNEGRKGSDGSREICFYNQHQVADVGSYVGLNSHAIMIYNDL